MTTKVYILDTPAKIKRLRALLVLAAPPSATSQHTKAETRNFAALVVKSLDWLCAGSEEHYNQLLEKIIAAVDPVKSRPSA